MCIELFCNKQMSSDLGVRVVCLIRIEPQSVPHHPDLNNLRHSVRMLTQFSAWGPDVQLGIIILMIFELKPGDDFIQWFHIEVKKKGREY